METDVKDKIKILKQQIEDLEYGDKTTFWIVTKNSQSCERGTIAVEMEDCKDRWSFSWRYKEIAL